MTERQSNSGVTLRSVAAGLALMVLANLLMRETEFVMGRYITAGVPPVMAVGGLLLLLLINGVLRGPLERYRFSRGEMLVAYAGLCLGCAVTGTYGVRSILPYFSALTYFEQPSNQFAQLAEGLPPWYVMRNVEAITKLYEGAPGTGVPWAAWRGVMLGWGSFLLVLFMGTISLMTLVRRPWMEHERLMFPVTQLPLALTDPRHRLIWSPVFWGGFFVALLINASNIGHAFIDSLPAIQPTINMPAELQRPWTPLRGMVLFNRPELYGFAYWVPNEILLSGWLSYLSVRAFAVSGYLAGLDQPGFPFTQEQSTGGYFALALLLVWAMRRHLIESIRAIRSPSPREADEPMLFRAAWIWLALSVAYCSWFLTTGGVPRWLAGGYILIVFVFVLVYARLRAEAGLALEFIYPYGYPRRFLIQALGSDTLLMAGGGAQGLTAFYVAGFLARFHIACSLGSYTMEGMRLAEAAQVKQRAMLRWLTVMFIIGGAVAVANYLTFNYQNGLNFFEGKPGTADWRTGVAVQEFNELNNYVLRPEQTDRLRLYYTIGGAAATFLLAAGRLAWLGFPLHPVGYVLATAYGETSPMWWPFLVIWSLKAGLLKYGGLKAYRRLLPFFVGFIVAHYLVGGLLWSFLSTTATRDIAHRYYTIFG